MTRFANVLAIWLAGLVALCSPPPAAGAPVLSLQFSVASASTGDLFTASVRITNAVDLYGFEFELAFDADRVEVLGGHQGGFLAQAGPTIFLLGGLDNAAGLVDLTGGSLLGGISGASGDGVLAEFQFGARSAGFASFSLRNALLVDSNQGLIVPALTGGGIAINDATGQPLPAPGTLALALPLALALLVSHGGWLAGRRRH